MLKNNTIIHAQKFLLFHHPNKKELIVPVKKYTSLIQVDKSVIPKEVVIPLFPQLNFSNSSYSIIPFHPPDCWMSAF